MTRAYTDPAEQQQQQQEAGGSSRSKDGDGDDNAGPSSSKQKEKKKQKTVRRKTTFFSLGWAGVNVFDRRWSIRLLHRSSLTPRGAVRPESGPPCISLRTIDLLLLLA